MGSQKIKPIRGFRDRFPDDKILQEYIFATARSVLRRRGFEEYDGPLLEPIGLYEGKTSNELLTEQAFSLIDKKGRKLLLRPEMTPTLARMVASQADQLVFPVRMFNIGLRYRYEAPQRGRNRELYQIDFDILGSDSVLADAEFLSTAVDLYKKFGGDENNLVVYINSRSVLSKALEKVGISSEKIPEVISIIDKRDKLAQQDFIDLLDAKSVDSGAILHFLDNPKNYKDNFSDLLEAIGALEIDSYIKVKPFFVRGLDYYTGLVFEVWAKKGLNRAIGGGGRYDNLVERYGSRKIPGIGMAMSDTAIIEFIKENRIKIPDLTPSLSTLLVTVFSRELASKSFEAIRFLRKNNIPCELYAGIEKLPKQFKYANKKGLDYVLIIGPDEAMEGKVTLKTMTTGEQEVLTLENVLSKLSTRIIDK